MDSELLDTQGVTYPRGFRASAINCGIRKDRLDLALVAADTPATAAGVFTRNLCCAAPVLLSKRHINSEHVRAIVVNSGNANAATGDRGLRAAEVCAGETARRLGCTPNEVLVASTGVIGVPLPFEKIVGGLDALVQDLSVGGGAAAAQAILTTDTFVKQRACDVRLGAGSVRIGGIAKGSGMIMPDMATLLGFITTDAAIDRRRLQQMLARAVATSFNRITVDGDTSTNDMVVLLASGASGMAVSGADEELFRSALERICTELARLIVRDGEGATKFVTVRVEGCATDRDADTIARAVANSPLVKTALCGCNPNWGRIIAAVGRAGVAFDPNRISVCLNGILACSNGMNAGAAKPVLDAVFKEKEIEIRIVLDAGPASATIWTCDLSHGYVDINMDYS